jgi:non-heme chloroperoxidase
LDSNPKCEAAKIVKGATLKVIAGAPHGMCSTLKDQINTELLAFFKGAATGASA